MKKTSFFVIAGLLCVGTTLFIVSPPTPRLFYNPSESAPVGWYVLDPNGSVMRDALVAAFAPADARNLAHDRAYVPQHVPLIKTVWAEPGERICREEGVVRVQNRPDAHALARDDLGRALPRWTGCFVLTETQVFLVSIDVQTSFDSRYFGPVEIENVLGTVRLIRETDRQLEDKARQVGRARGERQ